MKKNRLETKTHTGFYDITKEIIELIDESEIKNGQVVIQPMHTTVGVYVNENEPRLLEDLTIHLSGKAPQQEGIYLHDDIEYRDCPPDEPLNGHSHIKSALYSNPSVSLILYKGKLQLGKYQRILFAEFDGPCPRKNKSQREYLISINGE